jgi:hypothetical protein
MYELPAVGEQYWHGKTGYVVKALDANADPPRLDLELDRKFEERMSAGLPDDHFVDGGRQHDDGTWHFQIVGPKGIIGGGAASSRSDDMERAIAEAVASARKTLSR